MKALRRDLVKTPVPGPRSRALTDERRKYVTCSIGNETPVFIARGRGAMIEDVDGNTYIDFAGGIGALNVGHAPARIVDAIKMQAEEFLHTSFQVLMYEPYVNLVRRLVEITPGGFEKKGMLANSGAEAVENAIKIARAYTKRPGVVAFMGAFHGRTLLALSLTTSQYHPYKTDVGPFAPGITHFPYPYCYRCPFGLTYPSCDLHCAHHVAEVLKTNVPGDTVAATIVEPVLGEGGFVVAPQEWLPAIERICEEHGIVFVVDEIQTGFGRTGKMFASEHSGVTPDVIVLSKSLASGLPLSAVVGRAEIIDSLQPGGLGGTYGGNPLACVAGLEVIEMILQENLCERAVQVGTIVRRRFEDLKEKYPLVGDVRGLGAMVALELVRDRVTKEPAREETADIRRLCYEQGLLILKAGVYGNVLRCLVPLVATDEDLQLGLDILDNAMAIVSTRN